MFIFYNKYCNQMSTPPQPSFDQIVTGNIDIKKCSKNKYEITFSKISKFLIYQVWSDTYKKLNKNRLVYYQNAKKWVNYFNSLNASLKVSNKPLFTPTTVMEIGNKKYLFVIYKAIVNSKGRVVFKVSTKEILLRSGTSEKMSKLPCGHHCAVRFDIDDGGNLPYWCPLNDEIALYAGINLNGAVGFFESAYWEVIDTSTGISVLSSSQLGAPLIVQPNGGLDEYLVFTWCEGTGGNTNSAFFTCPYSVFNLQNTYGPAPTLASLYDIIVNNDKLTFFGSGLQ